MPSEEGDTVILQPFVNRKAPWAKGQVIRRLDDLSYEVRSGDHTYRRNRTHLKLTNEPPDKPTYWEGLSNHLPIFKTLIRVLNDCEFVTVCH